MHRNLCIACFASLLGMHGMLTAQTQSAESQASSAEHRANCKIDASPASPADIAYFRRDFKKAQELYAAAIAADPADGKSREHEIDSLLGQQKTEEANKKLDAWVASKPKDSYAMAAAADIQFSAGKLLESYALNLKALQTDPCNADAYADSAHFEGLAGYHAAARKHYTIAYQLEPNNESFRRDWISTLGESQFIAETKKFVAESKMLDDKQRSAREKSVNRAESISDNRCELKSLTGPAIIPMTPIYGHEVGIEYYGLEVAFNGHKRVLQIDTGASGFTLTHSAGGSLSLPSAFKTHIGGFGNDGLNDVDLARADSVRIGGLEFRNCVVEVLANYGVMGGSQIQGNRQDAGDGLVGTDIFSRYLVTVDYIRHQIRLEPLPQIPNRSITPENLDALGGSNDLNELSGDRYIAPSMQKWTSIYRRGHGLLMPVAINGKRTGLFMVDTGSFTNIVDTNRAKEFTKTNDGSTIILGLSGRGRLSEAGGFTLDFAGLRLPVESMDAMDLSSKFDVSGFLGYPTLQQLVMHIDYRDNLVFFEAPNGKKQ